MKFEFATAARIRFGCGAAASLASEAAALAPRPFVVTGRSTGRIAHLVSQLPGPCFAVSGEPSVPVILDGVQAARDARAGVIVAVGGGSAIDAAKAIAALVPNEGGIFDYLEVVGKALPLAQPALPVIAVPTTAGTGSEVTRNAVIASPEHRVKASLRHPSMLPRLALVDPELTYSLPPAITASTGLDALTQLIEPFVSNRANPVTDALCVEGIRRAAAALPAACENPGNHDARQDMALASLLGGIALANAGLGAVHGFAAPIGGRFPAPHGAVCAALLPYVMRANLEAGAARDRYTTVARLLTGDAGATAEAGVGWVAGLCRRLAIPSLGKYGIRLEDVPVLTALAAKASSMKANPVTLSSAALESILTQAL